MMRVSVEFLTSLASGPAGRRPRCRPRLWPRTEDQAALMVSLIPCKCPRDVFPDPFAEAAAMLTAVTG